MLLELRLENYAVIDSLAVEFAPGLNLLTGETGAGKSILVDALALLLGEKASSDLVRAGAEKAVLRAVFELEAGAEGAVARILEDNGLDAAEDGVILRREIAGTGKGRVYVNNQAATVSVLRQLAPFLASIHAQNESILAFGSGARLELLDAFAHTDLSQVEPAFHLSSSLGERIADLRRDEQTRLGLLDAWRFQTTEIDRANPRPGEDEHLEREKGILANAEKIFHAASSAFDLLYEGGASSCASMRAAEKHLEELGRYEPKFREAQSALEAARISVEDVGATLRDYAGGVEASPERLMEVEERLAVLDRLKRKYGTTLAAVVEFGNELKRKLSELENQDEALRQLGQELQHAQQQYLLAARKVSDNRKEAARKLEKLVEAEINDLAMRASFQIEVSGGAEEGNWTAAGFDQVIYSITSNPGEPLRRLEHIASGGELSRVMLALKASVEAGVHPGRKTSGRATRTLVFDEIDTGIGGRAAEAVGRKLKSLARSNQVLCVTHLPQIATFAEHHYLISKGDSGGRTRTAIRRIEGKERTEEIARMLSGAELTDTSRKHAQQMLKTNA
jgi:DNA repair protein RecN (Recombination protein N)